MDIEHDDTKHPLIDHEYQGSQKKDKVIDNNTHYSSFDNGHNDKSNS